MKTIIILLISFLYASGVNAITKCVNSAGSIAFTDSLCPTGYKIVVHESPNALVASAEGGDIYDIEYKIRKIEREIWRTLVSGLQSCKVIHQA